LIFTSDKKAARKGAKGKALDAGLKEERGLSQNIDRWSHVWSKVRIEIKTIFGAVRGFWGQEENKIVKKGALQSQSRRMR